MLKDLRLVVHHMHLSQSSQWHKGPDQVLSNKLIRFLSKNTFFHAE